MQVFTQILRWVLFDLATRAITVTCTLFIKQRGKASPPWLEDIDGNTTEPEKPKEKAIKQD